MTPKEKAQELFDKMDNISLTTSAAQQCAIIAVDLLISETFFPFYVNHQQPFWQEVKTELEKL